MRGAFETVDAVNGPRERTEGMDRWTNERRLRNSRRGEWTEGMDRGNGPREWTDGPMRDAFETVSTSHGVLTLWGKRWNGQTVPPPPPPPPPPPSPTYSPRPRLQSPPLESCVEAATSIEMSKVYIPLKPVFDSLLFNYLKPVF